MFSGSCFLVAVCGLLFVVCRLLCVGCWLLVVVCWLLLSDSCACYLIVVVVACFVPAGVC